jgi:hypothetical protein
MDFGRVLRRSWEIIWTNKVLWVFGILASCGSRSGGSGGGGGNVGSSFQGGDPTGQLPPQMQQFFQNIERWFETTPEDQLILYGLLFIFGILLLVLITWLVGLYGKSALISGVLQVEAGRQPTFGEIWSAGWAPFGRVVGLNTILGLLAFLAVALFIIPFVIFGALTAGIGILCLLPLLCLLIPLGFGYSVYTELANVAVVKEGRGATDAMERAWSLLRNNLGNLALMAIILVIGSFIVGIVVAIPIFIAVAPLIAGAISGTEQGFGQGMNVFLICLVVYIPVMIVFSGILQSYLQSAWTLTFNEISGVPATPAVRSPRRPAAPRKTATRTRSSR